MIVGDVSTGANAAAMQKFRDDADAVARASNACDAIRFLGWRDDVPAILRSSDAYVHSARWEGCSLAVMESLAAAVPTIYTANSGVPAGVVPGETAIVVDAADVPLTDAMREMVQRSESDRRRMARKDERSRSPNATSRSRPAGSPKSFFVRRTTRLRQITGPPITPCPNSYE